MNKEVNEFVCINCMHPAPSLFVTYSRDVIRMTECVLNIKKKCGSIVDKYVEYDIALIIIDLILQYKTAYRHVLINSKFKSFLRVIFIFIICDAYKSWIERRHHHIGQGQTGPVIFDLEWKFYESLLRSAIELTSYAGTLFFLLKIGQFKSEGIPPDKGWLFFFESALVSFYGDLFVVFSIIWQLHGQNLFKFLTQTFIIISHLQVQRALFPEYGLRNIVVVLLSICAQFAASKFMSKLMNYN